MQEHLVRFHLFGQEYAFYSEASAEEVDAAIALLRQELESEDKLTRNSVPSSKMLILGCLRMAAKCVQAQATCAQAQRDCATLRREQEQSYAQLIAKISAELK